MQCTHASLSYCYVIFIESLLYNLSRSSTQDYDIYMATMQRLISFLTILLLLAICSADQNEVTVCNCIKGG